MNSDELKGKIENLKGRAKEAFGALTGDKGTQAQGTIERAKGAIREKFGDAEQEAADRKSEGEDAAAREARGDSDPSADGRSADEDD